MPTDTKKMTANASRKGRRSAPIWWLNGDSLTMMPATKAPRASETPKNAADASAVPTAMVNATSTNNSRDLVCTTRPRIAGTTRAPTNIISATKSTALPTAMPTVIHGPDGDGAASAGTSTRIATIRRSSTTSQPIATFPAGLSSQP